MNLIGKNTGAVTPVKSKRHKNSRYAENSNPNVSPAPKSAASPAIKSAKSQKSASKNQNPSFQSPRNKIRERKFVVAKKKSNKEESRNDVASCKCKERNSKKCLCVAYENLRGSQEEFFKARNYDVSEGPKERELEEEIEEGLRIQDLQIQDDSGVCGQSGGGGEVGCSTITRRRDELLEEARKSVPERGKVIHLVQAFEKLLSIPSSKKGEEDESEEEEKAVAAKWALTGLQPPAPPTEPETQVSYTSFCPSDLFLTSENLGLDWRRRTSVSSSWDGSVGSVSSRTLNGGGRRRRRNSFESSSTIGGRRWKKKQQQQRATGLKPFKLRTEERGRQKEEEFMKKIQEMMMAEERQRIPIAQGLPWTTDDPECLLKPPVKEITIPKDLKLYSDMRAVERAEFDHQAAEKMSLFEQYKMERERLQKLEEEEEIRRLRRELVPKAQPMPYFDRPFIPRRSMKHPTRPKEPKFHVPQHKKIQVLLVIGRSTVKLEEDKKEAIP